MAPGVISNFIYGGTTVLFAGYGAYMWRGLGWRGFASKAVIPFVALVGLQKVTMVGVNWMREGVYSSKRANLV